MGMISLVGSGRAFLTEHPWLRAADLPHAVRVCDTGVRPRLNGGVAQHPCLASGKQRRIVYQIFHYKPFSRSGRLASMNILRILETYWRNTPMMIITRIR
jgi:hypothetical protein